MHNQTLSNAERGMIEQIKTDRMTNKETKEFNITKCHKGLKSLHIHTKSIVRKEKSESVKIAYLPSRAQNNLHC